jgi:3'(2'), 5'-bisphosphate nucleotidase
MSAPRDELRVRGASFTRDDALARVLEIAAAASELVMRVYKEGFDVEYKAKDDPVTRADREANALILAELSRAFPGVPVVAEESDPASFAGFERATCAWFVDPVDGTREFVAKNGEFAVMIGLAEEGRATLGVVACPALGRVFAGGEGLGAFEIAGGARRPICVSSEGEASRARAVVSRSHASQALAGAIARFAPGKVSQIGSAGIKAALVACGEAEVYMHPGRAGKRWDTCAPEAIVRAAGGEVTDATGAALDYRVSDVSNVRGLLVTNRALHGAGLRALGG